MRTCLSSFSTSLIAAICLAVPFAPNCCGQGLDQFKNSVVEVQVGRGANRAAENGTGFVVSADGGILSIVTARHLFVDGRDRFTENISVTFYVDKLRSYPASLLTSSAPLDVAVLKVENVPLSLARQLPKFSVRSDSQPLSIPETLHVFGGKSQSWQVSTVTVSDTGDEETLDGFRFNGNGIRAGFSGALILDDHGRLTGVHLGATDNDGIYGRAMRMSKAYEVLTSRLGASLNLLSYSGGSPVSDERTLPPLAPPAPGTEKLNSKDGLKYVWIPPGTFTMGCSPLDSDCSHDEKPPHSVTITHGFWLGETAVTVEAWKRYRLAANKSELPTSDSSGRKLNEAASGKNLPAVAMTWNEAGAFCEWSGGRLPSEAEWEYAARAGTTQSRYAALDSIAWFGDNSGNSPIDSTAIWNAAVKVEIYDKKLFENGNGPHPVARKRANAWNLYDMLGNVWQWTSDWYGEKYYDARTGTDPQGPDSGTQKALRGGSWLLNPRFVRVSNRGRGEPGLGIFVTGVRCVGEKFP